MSKIHVVELTWEEVLEGATAGIKRRCNAIARGYRGTASAAPGWDNDVRGGIGERAFCKYMGVPWDEGLRVFTSRPDVLIWEVRFGGPSLIIRPNDKDCRPFVQVVKYPQHPRYNFPGWIYAGDGKQKRWFTDKDNGRDPAYFVPQKALQPMETLPSVAKVPADELHKIILWAKERGGAVREVTE